MVAHSLDLRERIVDRYRQGKETYKEIAEVFGVGEATVSRLLRRDRERGDLTPDPIGGGFPPRIADAELPTLVQLVGEKPDRTLQELCEVWRARFGGEISTSSMHRSLERAGVTRKKSPSSRPSRTASTSRKSAARSSKSSRK